MPKNDTTRLSDSALRALRMALRQEVRRLEEAISRVVKGRPVAQTPDDYTLLGKLPRYLGLLASREQKLRSQLEMHRRSEPMLRQSLADLERLSTLSRQINESLELDEILKLLVELTSDIVETEGSMVHLYDEATSRYATVATHRLSDDAIRAIQFTLDSGVLHDIVSETHAIIVPEIATALCSGGTERSLILVPLRQKSTPIGLLTMLSTHPRQSFFEHDLDLLGLLANSVSVAISNAQLFERTKRLSVTDDLTQLANSRFLHEYLDGAITEAKRDDGKLSALFTDLDGFKAINDNYGHRMGSAVLVEVAGLLRRCVSKDDVVARFGGDEFVVVLPGCEAFKAFMTGEKIREAIAQHQFLLDFGLSAKLTISVGVATFPDHARSAEELIARSDTTMYVVKNNTKDGVSLSVSARTA